MKLVVYIFLLSGFAALAQTACDKASARTFQNELDQQFGNPMETPLKTEDLPQFQGLEFFKVSGKYQVQATLEVVSNPVVFEMQTTTSRRPKYRIYGYLHFQLQGKDWRLPVYQSETSEATDNYLFFPFTDLTNGKSTYKGGRYINLQIPQQGNQLCLDFNQAYNPYCAYNSNYSCPVVPEANYLDIAIKAGVKQFR